GGDSPGVELRPIGEGDDQLAAVVDGNASNPHAVIARYLAEIFLSAVGEGNDQLTGLIDCNIGNSYAVLTVRAVLAVGSVFAVDTVLAVRAICTCGLNTCVGIPNPPVAVAADIRGKAIFAVLTVLAVFPVLPVFAVGT